MKANELRIGNYLQDTNHPERFCRVFRLSSGNDYSITYSYNKAYEESYKKAEQEMFIQPIPLTEDLLVKSGIAEVKLFACGVVVLERFYFIWRDDYKYWYVVTKESKEYLTKIEFVHEYQNFIHALTGEELTMKGNEALPE